MGAQRGTRGNARHLREGSVEEAPDGTGDIDPIPSDTDLLLVGAGLSLPL